MNTIRFFMLILMYTVCKLLLKIQCGYLFNFQAHNTSILHKLQYSWIVYYLFTESCVLNECVCKISRTSSAYPLNNAVRQGSSNQIYAICHCILLRIENCSDSLNPGILEKFSIFWTWLKLNLRDWRHSAFFRTRLSICEKVMRTYWNISGRNNLTSRHW